MEAFKNLHKECEQLKTSGLSTAEIKRVKKPEKIVRVSSRCFVHVYFCWCCRLIAVYKVHRSELACTAAAFLKRFSVGKHSKVLALLRSEL